MVKTTRCQWANMSKSPHGLAYHDQEWGVPVTDDQRLFEFLILEGAQAGLSWDTILNKRDHYREVFDQFNPQKVALYDQAKIQDLLSDPGIIRNKLKVNAAVINAKLFLNIQKDYGSFAKYLWGFVNETPIQNHWTSLNDVPATSPESDTLSKDLKKRGFKFVGSTICYAYMQAVGLVNDHTTDCFRYDTCNALSTKLSQTFKSKEPCHV